MLVKLPEAITGGGFLYTVKPGSEAFVQDSMRVFKSRLRTYHWRGVAALAASVALSFLVSFFSTVPLLPDDSTTLVAMIAGTMSTSLAFGIMYHAARKTLVADLASRLSSHLRYAGSLARLRDCGATPEAWWEAAGIAREAATIENRAWSFWMGVTDNLESPHLATASARAALTAMEVESKALLAQAFSVLDQPVEAHPVTP